MIFINYINKLHYLFDKKIFLFIIAFFSPATLFAATPTEDLTGTDFGIAALVIFIIAHALVINEELLHLRKSKPVIVAAGSIWILVGISYLLRGDSIVVAANPRGRLQSVWRRARDPNARWRERRGHFPISIQRQIQAGLQ